MNSEEIPCTRRDLFKSMFHEIASAAVSVTDAFTDSLAPVQPPRPPLEKLFVRPPGALPENLFLQACTRCDDCIKYCPEWVIRKAGPEFGDLQEGYPVMLPAENPCLFCEGLPCIAACKTGALVAPAAGVHLRVGLAMVNAAKCYMGQSQPCDYCAKECPVRPKAISVGAPGRPAAVNAALCTGCGECAQICPANAITIEAMR